jgi:uncharacterized protein with GYD domain
VDAVPAAGQPGGTIATDPVGGNGVLAKLGLLLTPEALRSRLISRFLLGEGASRKGGDMPKYLILFGLKGETVGRFMENPSDRSEAVSQLVSQVGGELECYYFMFGQYDGAVIVSAPDSASVAAISVAVTGTGVFSSFETHELISSDEMIAVLQKAKEISYRPPGQ